MGITIDFTPEEGALLEAEANRRRVAPSEYVHALVHNALQECVLSLLEDRELTEKEKQYAASLDLSGVVEALA
ncbi:MAG: hypothetical protein NT023_16825 [Armatimonadetes bacterium]|nr:hypothetical protein [Armatimonadota bacterium]